VIHTSDVIWRPTKCPTPDFHGDRGRVLRVEAGANAILAMAISAGACRAGNAGRLRSSPLDATKPRRMNDEAPMIETCAVRRNLQDSRYVEYHAGVYPLGDSVANILVGARTRLATPYGRGGPVQPLSRGECWSSSRVYIGSTPTSLGPNFSTKGAKMERWNGRRATPSTVGGSDGG
jgi:hypothetical protein